MRAQIQGYQWFFLESDKREFDLIKETHDTTLFLPLYNGKFSIPFPVDHNNTLVQFFQKEKQIRRFTKPADVMDNKPLISHPSTSQWKTHSTSSVLGISKTKKMLLSQNQPRIKDRSILPKHSQNPRRESLLLHRL